jgi:hypothetical protein
MVSPRPLIVSLPWEEPNANPKGVGRAPYVPFVPPLVTDEIAMATMEEKLWIAWVSSLSSESVTPCAV